MDTTRPTLLMRIRDRADTVAWKEFDAIYRPLLLRFARASGLDATEAEEIAQQCLAAVAQHIDGFDYDPRKGRFKGWLRTIVSNDIRKRLRGRREQHAEAEVWNRMPGGEETPEQAFDRLWMHQHLLFCLDQVRRKVDPKTFTSFQRYVLDGSPVEQVCKELGMQRNQVYQSKWRITQMLEEQMRGLLEGDDAGSA